MRRIRRAIGELALSAVGFVFLLFVDYPKTPGDDDP